MGIEFYRTRPEHYAKIPRDTGRDTAISFHALGLLTHLLSLPPTWHISAKQLARTRREGQRGISRALAELRDAGYVQVITERGPDGCTRSHYQVADTKGALPKPVTSTNNASSQVTPGLAFVGSSEPGPGYASPNRTTGAKYGNPPPSATDRGKTASGGEASGQEDDLDRAPQIPPQPAQVFGDVGEQPQHRNAREAATLRWASPQAIAARQAAESRAQRERADISLMATGTGTH